MRFVLALLILCLGITNTFAYPEEQITSFSSNITINQDTSLDVTETIVVYADSQLIKHGIVRWLPINYRDSDYIKHHIHYELTEILLHNASTVYHVQHEDNQFVIYIGDKNILLAPGFYIYTLRYHITGGLNYLKDADELYWNVTGNAWNLPIEKVETIIDLPPGAEIKNYFAYTGPKNAKEQNYTVTKTNSNQLVFTSTQALKPGAGLTIAVAWPKGFVTEPTWQMQLRAQLENGGYWVLILSSLTCFYLLLAWYDRGRDVRKRTIIPLFDVPENLSPAAARFILHMGFNSKVYTAAILGLATKGIILINNIDGTFRLIQINKDLSGLSEEEEQLVNILFAKDTSITISDTNQSIIKKAKQQLKTSLQAKYEGKYFVTNTRYLIPSIILTIITFIVAISFAEDPSSALLASVWLTFWTLGFSGIISSAMKNVLKAYRQTSILRIIGAIITCLFAIPFLLGELIGIYMLADVLAIFTIPLLFFLIVLNVAFYYLLKAPTVEGQKVMDQIHGFKLFLATTERYRIKQWDAKETPALFEKYLPFAIALNVESAWSENFNTQLRQAGLKPDRYSPVWYTGTPWNQSTATNIGSFLSNGLDSSVGSVMASSSGSGGGGYSGGGGGGGGGGGW